MKVYRGRFTDDGDWVWEDSPYIFNNMMIGVGAMYVKRDIYSAGDLQNKRNYNYKMEYG